MAEINRSDGLYVYWEAVTLHFNHVCAVGHFVEIAESNPNKSPHCEKPSGTLKINCKLQFIVLKGKFLSRGLYIVHVKWCPLYKGCSIGPEDSPYLCVSATSQPPAEDMKCPPFSHSPNLQHVSHLFLGRFTLFLYHGSLTSRGQIDSLCPFDPVKWHAMISLNQKLQSDDNRHDRFFNVSH